MNQTVGVPMEDAFRMVALQLWSKQIGVEDGVRKIMSFVKAAPGPLIPLAKWDKHYDSPAVRPCAVTGMRGRIEGLRIVLIRER